MKSLLDRQQFEVALQVCWREVGLCACRVAQQVVAGAGSRGRSCRGARDAQSPEKGCHGQVLWWGRHKEEEAAGKAERG